MTFETYDHITQINPEIWDKMSGDNLYQKYDFLKALNDSKVEEAKYKYVLFYEENTIIGSAVLSIFKIDLGLFINQNRIVSTMRKWRKTFLKIPIVFCGTPVSLGHSNMIINAKIDEATIALNNIMCDWALENKVKYLAIKEQNETQQNQLLKILENLNWFSGNSLQDTSITIPFANYKDYLNQLKSKYRRQILGSLTDSKISLPDLDTFINDKTEIHKGNQIPIHDFYENYCAVMERAEVKLETLNRTFFTNLINAFGDNLLVISTQNNRNFTSYAMCLEHGEELVFLWTGRQQNNGSNDYFILLQAILHYAINQKKKIIKMGQTSYYPKQRIGAQTDDRFILFKCLNPFQNMVLKALRNLIFPLNAIQQINAFKESSTK